MAVAKLKPFDPFTTKQRATYRLFYLHGENEPLVRERAASLASAFAADGDAPALIDVSGDAMADEAYLLADELGSMSLFAERRILRVSLGARNASEAFSHALPLLPGADGVLVIVSAGADKRQDEVRNLLAADATCLCVDCPLDRAGDLAQYAQEILAAEGITIDETGAQELVALTDGDRGLLANELTKLCLMGERGDVLTPATLRAAVADESGFLLDEAADRILVGDVKAAIDTTDRLSGAGGDAVQLAGATLRKAVWAHHNVSGQRAADLRRAIRRLNDVMLADRTSDPFAGSRADLTLIRAAQFLRRR